MVDVSPLLHSTVTEYAVEAPSLNTQPILERTAISVEVSSDVRLWASGELLPPAMFNGVFAGPD
jgi:hypothetical protein